MKKLAVATMVSVFFMMSLTAMAQEQTLITGQVQHGGFGGPVMKITTFRDDVGLLVGGRGGWIINHVLALGGGGYGLTNNIEAPIRGYYLNVGYGGPIVEYIIASNRLVHASVNLLIGAGGVNYREDYWDIDEHSIFIEEDAFFVMEPGVDLELNVTNFLRVNAGISYRLIDGVESRDLDDSDMSGVAATLMLKFGKF
jgi:hypothetical protein